MFTKYVGENVTIWKITVLQLLIRIYQAPKTLQIAKHDLKLSINDGGMAMDAIPIYYSFIRKLFQDE